MSKKILASIMTFIIFATTLCKVPVFAAITYLDADGVTQSVDNATQITSELTTWTGWVYATGDVTIETRVEITGETHLILCDGCNLNCNAGIRVPQNNSFTIYGQTSNNWGNLTATAKENGQAGIGGNSYYEKRNHSDAINGPITVNGGKIIATGFGINENSDYYGGAGIGTGNEAGSDPNKPIIINNGEIIATGGYNAAGIGAGFYGCAKDITINGGKITANGSYYGAGIGSSYKGVQYITINGGEIIANGGKDSAGIGSGYSGNAEHITINGGKIFATCKEDESGYSTMGAGVGGGYYGYVNTLTINGGEITAIAGDKSYGAGIGGGYYGGLNSNGITINGGKITAIGGKNDWGPGAGIGSGGPVGCYGSITIKGGEIVAIGGISSSGKNAAGIGCAGNANSPTAENIRIIGGKIKAIAGPGANGIGCGVSSSDYNKKNAKFYTEDEENNQKGTAFIETTSITDESGEKNWNAIIHLLENKKWIIGGDQTYDQEITVENDETMYINENAILNQIAKFVNNGKMFINGKLNATGTTEWNSEDVSGIGEITPESAKIPTNFAISNLNLDKNYDGKPADVDFENLSSKYNGYGKDGAGELTIIHKKGNEILKEMPSEIGEYSVTISAETGRFYKSIPEIIKNYKIKETPIKIDFSYSDSDNSEKNEDKKDDVQSEKNSSKKTVVEISDGETKKVEYEDGTANITAKKSDNILEIEIKDEEGNDLSIKGKVNLVVSCDNCKPETVATEVKPDGTHKIIRDSVAKNDNIYIPLNKSTKLEIINNSKNFDDVSVNHWASNSVAFTSAHELLIGTETNIFGPELPISRSMFTQILHNFENNPNQIYENIFDDVKPTDWFSKPVIWAAKHNGTVIGYGDGNFGPNDNITREQLATILYRYFGKNEIVDTDLNFADANQISDYALKAIKWAVNYKIIRGKENNILVPKGLATRAEVAQMFQNLMAEFVLSVKMQNLYFS